MNFVGLYSLSFLNHFTPIKIAAAAAARPKEHLSSSGNL